MSKKILLPLFFILVLAFPAATDAAGTLPVTGPKQPVVMSKVAQPRVKELPKTGLPPLSVLLVGLIPIGYKLRNFGQDNDDKKRTAQDIWFLRSNPR